MVDERMQGIVEESRVVDLPGGRLAYTLRRSPRAHRLRVTLDPRRGVIVAIPPRTRRGWARPDSVVEEFLRDREAWIRRHTARQARQRAELVARGGLTDGAVIRFRGELHTLRVERRTTARRSTLSREPGDGRDELVVRLAATDRRDLGRVMRDALVARARTAIDREIGRHAEALGVRPAAVSVRDQRTRWGSASRQGRLSFSWRLILAPPEALETVVIHELAHLRVFGHGPRFWALVASRRSDHAIWRRWLRDHSVELHDALETPDLPAAEPERPSETEIAAAND